MHQKEQDPTWMQPFTCANAVIPGMYELSNHSDFEVLSTYQSRSLEVSCRPDLAPSRILICGTLLWKQKKKQRVKTWDW